MKSPSTERGLTTPDLLEVVPPVPPAAIIDAPTPPSTSIRFDAIDGLRGFACLMVLAFHCYVLVEKYQVFTFTIGRQRVALSDLYAFGYAGVDLFFVLSGFCLSYPILSKPNKPVDWKRYAINRARRLLPPFYAAVFMFGVLSFIITQLQLKPYFGLVLRWPTVNEWFYTLSLAHYSLNGSFWTLVLEWRWYFIFPIFIFLLHKGTRASWLVLATIPISALFLTLYADPAHASGTIKKLKFITTELPCYLPHFALGIWAAEIAARHRRTKFEQFLVDYAAWGIVAGLIIVAISPKVGNHVHWSRLVSWGPVFFFLVLAALHSPRFVKVFSWKPLVQAGIFSYSLYLVHDPLLRAFNLWLNQHETTVWGRFFIYQGLVFWSLIGIGYLFFLVAEKPFLRKPVKQIAESKVG